MAIDLFCYTSYPEDEAQKLAEKLADLYPHLFSRKFWISKVKTQSSIGRKFAMEYGFVAECCFLIGVNDKSQLDLLPEVVDVTKTTFQEEKILILKDNEVLQ